VGRFAVAADPGGAVFLLFKPNPGAARARALSHDEFLYGTVFKTKANQPNVLGYRQAGR
jgi:hypothetical protein